MSAVGPFAPYLPDGTTALTVTTTAQSISPGPSGQSSDYRCVNNGTATVYLLAQPQGPSPVAVTAANGMPMLPGTFETFSWPPNVLLSVIGSATGSVLSVTPGEGT